jgi:phage-related protein
MTYSESLGFSYGEYGNFLHSSAHGIINVKTNSGLFEEQFLPTRSIVEEKTFGRKEPYFFGFEYSPIEIPLTLFFEDGWDEYKIKSLVSWICRDTYQPLIFDEDDDRIFYCMYVGDPKIIHNGVKQGMVTITMRCNSPFAYSRVYQHEYSYTNNTLGTEMTFYNYGNIPFYPTFIIEKIGNGDISIVNTSNEGYEMKFTGLLDKEVVTIDGGNEDITTSIPNTYRYNNHNGVFLEMTYGQNHLMIYGDANLLIKYQCKLLV